MVGRNWIHVPVALAVAGCLAAAATAAAPKPTFKASATALNFGRTVTFAGKAGTTKGTVVSLLAKPCGFTSSAATLKTKTGAGGIFKFSFRPAISTVYQASSNQQTSRPARVVIKPLVQVRRVATGRYAVDVSTGAGQFLKRKTIVLQRSAGKGWKAAATAPLKATSDPTAIIAVSSATLKAGVPKGSKVRAVLSAPAAAPCYAPSASAAIAG